MKPVVDTLWKEPLPLPTPILKEIWPMSVCEKRKFILPSIWTSSIVPSIIWPAITPIFTVSLSNVSLISSVSTDTSTKLRWLISPNNALKKP